MQRCQRQNWRRYVSVSLIPSSGWQRPNKVLYTDLAMRPKSCIVPSWESLSSIRTSGLKLGQGLTSGVDISPCCLYNLSTFLDPC